jgi:hypothetical protein
MKVARREVPSTSQLLSVLQMYLYKPDDAS